MHTLEQIPLQSSEVMATKSVFPVLGLHSLLISGWQWLMPGNNYMLAKNAFVAMEIKAFLYYMDVSMIHL